MKIFKLDLVLSLLATLLVGLKRLIVVKNQKFKSTLKHMNPIIPDPEAVVQPSKPTIIQTTESLQVPKSRNQWFTNVWWSSQNWNYQGRYFSEQCIRTSFQQYINNKQRFARLWKTRIIFRLLIGDESSQNDSQKYLRYVEDTSMLIRISFIWTWTRNKLLRHFTFYRSIWM